MVHGNRFIATLLLAGALTGAAACSHDAPRADEALFIRPGVTSGGTGMGGVEPRPAAQALYGTHSVSLGSTYDPGTARGGATNSTTVSTNPDGSSLTVITRPTPQPASGEAGYGTATSAGTVSGNYGTVPTNGASAGRGLYGSSVGTTAASPTPAVGAVITH
jgi:hypothetical protein